MPYVRARVVAADIAIAIRVDRQKVLGIARVAHHHAAVMAKAGTVAPHTRGQHAVEHIHAAHYALHQAVGRANAHQITRLVARHFGFDSLQHFIHHGLRFAHAQTAYAVPDEVHVGQMARAFDAQVAVQRALYNAKQCLILTGVRLLAARRPAVGALHVFARGLFVARPGRAYVKRHRYVAAQLLLNHHGAFGGQALSGAVDVAAEVHAVLLNLAQTRQREHLKSARVGQYRTRPVHELVQPARALDQIFARTQVQVIGVGQYYLRVYLQQFARANGHRIVCVGTTSVRTLESASTDDGIVHAGSGDTSIFIYPGYKYKAVDALITNFHLPGSTLVMLVSAFMGRENALSAYKEAVEKEYRFFSFGDAMFIR